MKVTICSLYPREVRDTKPGIIPYEYIVPPSNGIIPTLLVIEDGKSPLYRGSEMPTFQMTVPAESIAKSLVNDFCKAQLAYEPDAHPAVFWVPEELTSGKEAMDKYPVKIAEAKKAQMNWFEKLFRLAEDEWNRNHQHKTITEIQRFAAGSLGKTNVEWYTSPDPVPMIKCPACATLVEANAIVCRNCKMILQPDKAKTLAFAG